MTQHELNGKIICALEVRKSITSIVFVNTTNTLLTFDNRSTCFTTNLPNGKYQFLTLSKDMTEEVAKTIMPKAMEQHYYRYPETFGSDRWVKSALESFRTWEKSVGIVTVNEPNREDFELEKEYLVEYMRWQQAQSLVKNIAYLVKEG